MRKPLISGNWKMNTKLEEAENLVRAMLAELDSIYGVGKVLCPPFISLATIKELTKGTSIELGAQNMYFEAKGAYTGEISPLMLSELCDFVILGHSERRWYFGETDEIVNNKVKAALANRLKPILCVGERLEENEAGKTEDVVSRQVTTALNGIEPVVLSTAKNLVIAYEPVWAIGTGRAANGKQAAATIQFIRDVVAKLWNKSIAQDLRILYGGGVPRGNMAWFFFPPAIAGR